jgi:hypothetical protein
MVLIIPTSAESEFRTILKPQSAPFFGLYLSLPSPTESLSLLLAFSRLHLRRLIPNILVFQLGAFR